MSKAAARHAKRGLDKRGIATKVAAKKEARRTEQGARAKDNEALMDLYNLTKVKGEAPSRTIRRYLRGNS